MRQFCVKTPVYKNDFTMILSNPVLWEYIDKNSFYRRYVQTRCYNIYCFSFYTIIIILSCNLFHTHYLITVVTSRRIRVAVFGYSVSI